MIQGSGGSAENLKHQTIMAPRRRDEVLAFIMQCLVKNRVSPTLEEIAAGVGISKSRARQLVDQLVQARILAKTPGAQRNLIVRDITHARELLVQALNELGGTTALPMGEIQQPCPNVQLPKLLDIRHLPDE